jgi:hypothetical protein
MFSFQKSLDLRNWTSFIISPIDFRGEPDHIQFMSPDIEEFTNGFHILAVGELGTMGAICDEVNGGLSVAVTGGGFLERSVSVNRSSGLCVGTIGYSQYRPKEFFEE